MRRVLSRWALLPVAAVLAVAVAAFASAGTNYTSLPVNVTCTSTGQVCDPTYQLPITTSSQLDLEFTSATTSCASFSVDFLVDGATVFTSSVLAPGISTGTFVAGPLTAGTHTVGVRATGVTGGCDTGTLQAWSGRLGVTYSSAAVPPPPPPPPTPTPTPALSAPTSTLQCLDGGWRTFTALRFENQGACVRYLVSHGHGWSRPEHESDDGHGHRGEASRPERGDR